MFIRLSLPVTILLCKNIDLYLLCSLIFSSHAGDTPTIQVLKIVLLGYFTLFFTKSDKYNKAVPSIYMLDMRLDTLSTLSIKLLLLLPDYIGAISDCLKDKSAK